MSFKETFTVWYNKNYKLLLIIPIILLVLSLTQLGYTFYTTGDFIERDITLTGGTSITVFVEQEININQLSDFLNGKIDDFIIRELSDFRSGKQIAIVIDTISELD